MGSDQIYPNSLVKKVCFQIRFPNLFYLADRIGNYQAKIMKQFPESKLLMRRQFMVITGTLGKKEQEELSAGKQDDSIEKVWVFESGKGVTLEVSSGSRRLVDVSR